MIDIESQVYRAVLAGLTPTLSELGHDDPSRHVTSDYVKQPAVFPHVSVVEINNSTETRTQSTTGENHAALTYEVSSYSNKQIGRKTECKALAKAADEAMLRLGFTRISLEPVPNLLDATVHRIVGRYTALVSKDEILYRR